MLPGPNSIYKCPDCEQLCQTMSLMSGNTFGAIFFSDGSYIAPMLPQTPRITKCSRCSNIFWLDKKNLLGINEWNNKEEVNSNWDDAPMASFLTYEDLKISLENRIFNNIDEEFYLRKHFWWVCNGLASNKKNAVTHNLKDFYFDNAKRLIEILDSESDGDKMIIAELYRNIGSFDECMQILKGLNEDKNIIRQYIEKCTQKDTQVFRLIC